MKTFLPLAVLLAAAVALPQQPAAIPQQLTFTPYHFSGIYEVGETVGWTVTPGPVAPTYRYRWTARRNNSVVLQQGTLDFASGKDKIEIAGTEPEMVYIAVEPFAVLSSENAASAGEQSSSPHYVGGNTGRNNGLYAVGAAVAPTRIGLAAPRPADFDSFWAGKLKEQARIAMHPVVNTVPTDVPAVELNTFRVDALGSFAQGYLARPSREGKFPALVLLQYAGVYALNAHAAASAAAQGWLVMNVDSHDKSPADAGSSIPKNYAGIGNTDRETAYFLKMYLRDSRALDFLMTRPEWDGKTIVLMGTSMGGQQSLVLAGLRPEKITAVLVNVPAGADLNGDLHGRKAGFPSWPSTNPKVMQTALYFDPVNFAPRIHAPVLAAMGFIDTISPPAGIWTVLNQIPAAVEPLPMIESEHNNLTPKKEQNWDVRSKEVLGILLRGGRFEPRKFSTAAVPDWALPGSAAHRQVAPPAGFHRDSRIIDAPVGIFEGQADIGSALAPGSASYDPDSHRYTIHSAGYNIWYSRDEFRFLWKKMSGDVSLAASAAFPDSDGYGDRKAVLVIRQSLEDDSPEVMIGQHGVGMLHLAERTEKGANIQDLQYRFGGMLSKVNASRIGIEKRGDTFSIWVSIQGEPIQRLGPPVQLHFQQPFYVGIGFCSHIPDKSDVAILSGVTLENAAGAIQ